MNLGLRLSWQGLFGVPELSSPAGFEVTTNEALRSTERLLEKACSGVPGVETVESFDQLSDGLCKVADLVSSMLLNHKYCTDIFSDSSLPGKI